MAVVVVGTDNSTDNSNIIVQRIVCMTIVQIIVMIIVIVTNSNGPAGRTGAGLDPRP